MMTNTTPHHSFLALPDPTNPNRMRRIHVLDWQPEGPPRDVLICIHGLTRNAHDFDFLAAELVGHGYRVIAASMAGRGQSDRLSHPAGYALPCYAQDCLALLGQFGITQCSWLGTSMGGMIGMGLAAMPESPITRLILNDVGAVVPAEALNRIGQYVGMAPEFASLAEGEAYLREVALKSFGIREEAHWQHMAHYSLEPRQGKYRMAYDPAIADAYRMLAGEGGVFTEPVDLSPAWNAVTCPVLLLQGADSDLLTDAICQQMQKGRSTMRHVAFPGVGHAPTLMDAGQIAAVRDWLASTSVPKAA